MPNWMVHFRAHIKEMCLALDIKIYAFCKYYLYNEKSLFCLKIYKYAYVNKSSREKPCEVYDIRVH